MKRVIVNADDFGLHSSINRGIVEAYLRGMVSSTSLMVCGDAFLDAVDLIQKHQMKHVGVHLVLDEERPILSPKNLPSLVSDQGTFYSRGRLIKRLCLRQVNLFEVENELRAQIMKALDHGIVPTHLDGHGHVHVYPYIYPIVIKLGEEFKIKRTRLPREVYSFLPKKNILNRLFTKGLMGVFLARAEKKYRDHGFQMPDSFFGISAGGQLSIDELNRILSHMKHEGVTEIMTHPGYDSCEISPKYKAWNYKWELELDTMLAMNQIKLKSLNIEMVSFLEI